MPRFGALRAALARAADAAQLARRAFDERTARHPAEARALLARASSSAARVHVEGLRGSASVFLLEAIRRVNNQPLVVVCPDSETAADAASDFRTVSGVRVVHFPDRDIFPRLRESHENLAVRGARNEALLRIARGGVDIVVTSVLGFLEKTIPAAQLSQRCIVLRCDQSVDLDDMRAALVRSGYELVSIVEEPGQFAVRGAILDVFDPAWDRPARVELLDDEIESIREFDIHTQRSVAAVESVTVVPASSIPLADDFEDTLRAELQARGFEKVDIERIVDVTGSRPSSLAWRRYAPLLGMGGWLIDYFAENPLVVFSAADACNREWRNLSEEFERIRERPDEFPPLEFSDYVNSPAQLEHSGCPVLVLWQLAARESTAKSIRARELAEDDGPQASGTHGKSGMRVAGGPDAQGSTREPTDAPTAAQAMPSLEGDSPPLVAQSTETEPTMRLATAAHPSVVGTLDPLVRRIRALSAEGTSITIYAETPTQRERLAELLGDDEALVHLPVGWLTSGFIWKSAALAVFTDHQVFGRVLPRPVRRRSKRRNPTGGHLALTPGDAVVHIEYGIGRFVGLEKLSSDGRDTECLVLRFHGDDRIFVPLDQMHLVEKYVGKEGVVPQLDRLGGTRWQKTRERTRRAVEETARDLLAVYAAREVAIGHAFGPDTPWQRELEASFPWEETPHQLRATDEVKEDMQLPRPMDRLVCGDVGFGKTEVAIRAAFKAASEGKQVAVIVPTTLLAFQHFKTFAERMARFPLRVEMLSRFVSPKDQKRIVREVKAGSVDIVVGTHRLLSNDIAFHDLGLLIVDEEHRFGVKHKERLKQLTTSVDVLALTATPIPRTLYMALSGLRKISVIDTPPQGRHPVRTEVRAWDEEAIRRIIIEEISRDGQVFFVHNRVRSIHSMTAYLEKLLPGVRFGTAHGQMEEQQLERVVLDFMDRKYDVLVSTMIIESGLDYPNVNTIVVNRADRFGLAQLYQLRGRVGRRERQAYALLLVPRQMSMSRMASKRLEAMEEFEDLGSGYRLAMRDLEIRGAGNVLGVEQTGHVTAVGFEMYCRMLKEAVDTLSGEVPVAQTTCRVEAPYECYVPESTVADPDERMMIYRRLAGMTRAADIDELARELEDRFGRLDSATRNLLELTQVKVLAAMQGVVLVRIREPGYRPPAPEALDRAADVPPRLSRAPGNVRRAHTGSSRLARLATRLESGEFQGISRQRGGVTLEFAPDRAFSPQECAALVETFGPRLLFKSGKTFGVTLTAATGVPLLRDTRNLLQVSYFSTRIGVSPDQQPGDRTH